YDHHQTSRPPHLPSGSKSPPRRRISASAATTASVAQRSATDSVSTVSTVREASAAMMAIAACSLSVSSAAIGISPGDDDRIIPPPGRPVYRGPLAESLHASLRRADLLG